VGLDAPKEADKPELTKVFSRLLRKMPDGGNTIGKSGLSQIWLVFTAYPEFYVLAWDGEIRRHLNRLFSTTEFEMSHSSCPAV
jgi:hypothetical protein